MRHRAKALCARRRKPGPREWAVVSSCRLGLSVRLASRSGVWGRILVMMTAAVVAGTLSGALEDGSSMAGPLEGAAVESG